MADRYGYELNIPGSKEYMKRRRAKARNTSNEDTKERRNLLSENYIMGQVVDLADWERRTPDEDEYEMPKEWTKERRKAEAAKDKKRLLKLRLKSHEQAEALRKNR